MVPTILPELLKPSRTLRKSQQPQFQNPNFQRKNRGKFLISLINPFFGGPPRGRGGTKTFMVESRKPALAAVVCSKPQTSSPMPSRLYLSGWSRPPMGFYLGILTKWPPPQGGVHKIQILIRDLLKDFLRKFSPKKTYIYIYICTYIYIYYVSSKNAKGKV